MKLLILFAVFEALNLSGCCNIKPPPMDIADAKARGLFIKEYDVNVKPNSIMSVTEAWGAKEESSEQCRIYFSINDRKSTLNGDKYWLWECSLAPDYSSCGENGSGNKRVYSFSTRDWKLPDTATLFINHAAQHPFPSDSTYMVASLFFVVRNRPS